MNGCAICHRPLKLGFPGQPQLVTAGYQAGYQVPRVSQGIAGYQTGVIALHSTCIEQVLAPLNLPSLGGEGVARLRPISGVSLLRVCKPVGLRVWEERSPTCCGILK